MITTQVKLLKLGLGWQWRSCGTLPMTHNVLKHDYDEPNKSSNSRIPLRLCAAAAAAAVRVLLLGAAIPHGRRLPTSPLHLRRARPCREVIDNRKLIDGRWLLGKWFGGGIKTLLFIVDGGFVVLAKSVIGSERNLCLVKNASEGTDYTAMTNCTIHSDPKIYRGLRLVDNVILIAK